jgi:hypothetical protein
MYYMWINKNLVHQFGDQTKGVHLVGSIIRNTLLCCTNIIPLALSVCCNNGISLSSNATLQFKFVLIIQTIQELKVVTLCVQSEILVHLTVIWCGNESKLSTATRMHYTFQRWFYTRCAKKVQNLGVGIRILKTSAFLFCLKDLYMNNPPTVSTPYSWSLRLEVRKAGQRKGTPRDDNTHVNTCNCKTSGCFEV